jgi:N-acetylmuramidase/Putative peptidoglycan binding domain
MNEELQTAIEQCAHRLGIEPEVFQAVIAIESAGRLFAAINGKPEPLIRFEGHYFDRRLEGITQARARLRGLASPRAGVIKNPASQAARWQMLEKAIAINRAAALESTSWGVGQVMGAHWKWLGYHQVEALVSEVRSGIAGQLSLMERYIEKAGLVSALKNKNWAAFAKGYNGPFYTQNGYHLKLAEAYAVLKQMTPEQHPKRNNTYLRIGSKGEQVMDLQRQLAALGFSNPQSGIFDQQTENALKDFQKHCKISADGIAGPTTFAAIERELPQFKPFESLWSAVQSVLARIF